jgi:hypothetical protein
MAQAPEVQGDWFGSDLSHGAPSSLHLSLSPRGGGHLRFGAGRHCTLTLQRAFVVPGPEDVYDVIDANGGRYCDALVAEQLILSSTEGALSVGLHADEQARRWTLWRADAKAPGRTSASVSGRWAGAVKRAGAPLIDVGLTIDAAQPGQKAGRLRYGGSRRCALSLHYEGASEGAHFFSVDPPESSGGYCEMLAGRTLRIWIDDDALHYRYAPGNEDCRDACRLMRQHLQDTK